MSPELRPFVGINAAAEKVTKSWVTVRRDNYPKQTYSTNKRISFGGAWRK